ncbi:MAG: hypothetical protein DMF49_11540 [Acidobacteria bacterium]|nr:MAG: hypothetical protein DMF49_11540 [Acidobacteriota bacterium]
MTGFFREAEAFEALTTIVFPSIVKGRSPGDAIRVWVAGCSTGEEAYSIAICLMEFLSSSRHDQPVQIFATDVSDAAIETARAGTYSENITPDVSPERLRRFFSKVDRGYQISKQVRDICIFARQDLTRDPPFSRLDLISCRNVLIYLGPVLQKRVIPIFHYALKPTGFLLLGKSEAVGSFSDMFAALDRKHRIYAKKATPSLLRTDFVPIDLATAGGAAALPATATARDDLEVQREADRIVLAKYAPAGVLVNENLDIVHFRGRTGAYLEPGSGQPSLNLMRMARQGLSLELRTAIQKARRKGEPVRKEGIQLDSSGRNRIVSIEVIPLKVRTGGGRYHIVNFEEAASAPERKAAVIRPAKLRAPDREIERLKKELEATKEYLQSIIEEQNATNEELKSANEEILSSNEELSSTNEELETAKEELQATNEELTTVNEELQNRNLELSQLNNDLNNVLASANIPIVFLGPDLRVRRCTPMAEKALNLIPSDIGRRITDIKPNIHVPDLEKMVLDVIETVSLRERQVQDSEA